MPAIAGMGSMEAVAVVPIAATMAESPALLHGFLDLRERFAQTGFSGAEIQVLSLVSAFENRCGWCVAFHTAMALKGVAQEVREKITKNMSERAGLNLLEEIDMLQSQIKSTLEQMVGISKSLAVIKTLKLTLNGHEEFLDPSKKNQTGKDPRRPLDER